MKKSELRQIIKEEIKRVLNKNLKLEIDDDYVELSADSGEYSSFVEDNGKVSFSVVYDDEDDRDGMEFDEDNWKSILGPNHAFVEIASKIPTEVEALDDYVMITVDLEDLKKISDIKYTEDGGLELDPKYFKITYL